MLIKDNPPEGEDEYMMPVSGFMIASTKKTRLTRAVYFFSLAIPWAAFYLWCVDKAFQDQTTTFIMQGIAVLWVLYKANLLAEYVEITKRRADFGNAFHAMWERLLVDPELRERWNEVAEVRCPAAYLTEQEDVLGEGP